MKVENPTHNGLTDCDCHPCAEKNVRFDLSPFCTPVRTHSSTSLSSANLTWICSQRGSLHLTEPTTFTLSPSPPLLNDIAFRGKSLYNLDARKYNAKGRQAVSKSNNSNPYNVSCSSARNLAHNKVWIRATPYDGCECYVKSDCPVKGGSAKSSHSDTCCKTDDLCEHGAEVNTALNIIASRRKRLKTVKRKRRCRITTSDHGSICAASLVNDGNTCCCATPRINRGCGCVVSPNMVSIDEVINSSPSPAKVRRRRGKKCACAAWTRFGEKADNRLLSWECALAERERIAKKICRRTGKCTGQLLFNRLTTVDERENAMLKRLMEHAQNLVYEEPCKCLKKKKKCSCMAKSRNSFEVSGLPAVTQQELNSSQQCRVNRWLASPRLQERLVTQLPAIKRVVPFFPDIENLQVVGRCIWPQLTREWICRDWKELTCGCCNCCADSDSCLSICSEDEYASW